MSLRSSPVIRAEMFESPLYQVMGGGLTDRIFILGHADAPLNDPIQVASMNETLNQLNSDPNSPLVRALLEAFLAGARDLWAVPVAPMSEYEPDLDNRDTAYYATYRDRLNDTYDILKYWDIANITVPVDAPFNSTVDFLGPLAAYTIEAFNLSGDIHLGIMGTRGEITPSLANALSQDGRLENLGDGGKFISVFAGDGAFNFPVLETSHVSSVAAAVAGQISNLPLDRGITFIPLKNVIRSIGADLPKDNISQLAEAGINYVGRNIRGRRGNTFQTVAFTDNTLAKLGSDYWSMVQMRLVSVVSADVRALGKRQIGTIGYGLFKTDVNDYLSGLRQEGVIRDYQLTIERDPEDLNQVFVEIILTPYFGLRDITVDIFVGPSIGGEG